MKNMKTSSQKYQDNKLRYDVTYSIDNDGLRISPPCDDINCAPAILFFGCSFIFGEGLNDDQTMPYLVGSISNKKVYNFGFQGYGPNQMLSAIEHGLVKRIVTVPPKYAVFETAYFHIERAAGYPQWKSHSPKYVLRPDGKVKYASHFDDSPVTQTINNLIEKSSLYQNFFKYQDWPVSKTDIIRYLSIVIDAKNDLVKTYPGLEFHVIYWDYLHTKQDKMILDKFKREGIKVHLISDILPDWNKKYADYQLFDGHPNALANKYIADYVIKNILHKSGQY